MSEEYVTLERVIKELHLEDKILDIESIKYRHS